MDWDEWVADRRAGLLGDGRNPETARRYLGELRSAVAGSHPLLDDLRREHERLSERVVKSRELREVQKKVGRRIDALLGI